MWGGDSLAGCARVCRCHPKRQLAWHTQKIAVRRVCVAIPAPGDLNNKCVARPSHAHVLPFKLRAAQCAQVSGDIVVSFTLLLSPIVVFKYLCCCVIRYGSESA